MFGAMSSATPDIAPGLRRLLDASFDATLRASVRRHLRQGGTSGTGFGRRVLGDPGFAARYLDGGASVRLDTADRIRAFLGERPFRPVFLAEVETFVEMTGVAPWAVEQYATRQAGFVARLRAGASPWLRTMDRVRTWTRAQLRAAERRALVQAVAEGLGNAAGPEAGGARKSNGEPKMTHPPKLLTTAAAAECLGLSPRTLERYRVSGAGPRFRKIGRWVRYVPADLAEWLDGCARSSTSDDGRAGRGRT